MGETAGIPGVHESVPREYIVEGYKDALARFYSATNNPEDPAFRKHTFIPLFAALAFAGSLVETVLEPKREGDMRSVAERKSLAQGVRYVRNRVLHQWSAALRPCHIQQPPPTLHAAGHGGETRPTVIFDWFWRPLEELPPVPPNMAPDELGRESYVEFLASKPARLALEEIKLALE